MMHNSFSQNKQEEKEWRTVYSGLNTREVREIPEAYTGDIKTIEGFLKKYPTHGKALYFLKDDIFQLLFWTGIYDSSYTLKYLDVLNRCISLPDETQNGCSDKKMCKMAAIE